ncbi:MAG: rhomboid family intramembrane serine protease [Simkaniaceae bacterium]|nr:rhomboid family intramembrane serine protease [Simkaniaceae bacterium]
MRLIGKLENEKETYLCYSFLLREGIENVYDAKMDSSSQKLVYSIWIIDEDQLERAQGLFEEFKNNPKDSKYQANLEAAPSVEKNSQKIPFSAENPKVRVVTPRKAFMQKKNQVTKFVILLCILFFVWDGFQRINIAKNLPGKEFSGFSPLATVMMYDYPEQLQKFNDFTKKYPEVAREKVADLPPEIKQEFQSIENIPTWTGFYDIWLNYPKSKPDLDAPTFTKIKEGQVWRLITPCLMHGGILHILFNMLWLWMLGSQVEERISKGRYILLMLIVGVVSNTAQYLMSGPAFIGYSGIVAGLAGFIWMRQKIAPWEGYPLPKGTVVFLVVFILGMLALQIVSFILTYYKIANFPIIIANTAHVVGALSGIVLARIPALSKGAS